MSKYNARRTTRNGYTFDSLAEADYYQKLAMAEKAGQISDLAVHPTFELQPAFTDRNGKKQRAIIYEADFSYIDKATGKRVIADYKGVSTRLFLLKYKMFLFRYPELDLRIVK